MERDDAMELTRQVSALQATVEGGLMHLGKRMDSQDRKLDVIESQVRLTNGRVTQLEAKDRSRAETEDREYHRMNDLPPLNWATLQTFAQFSGWVIAAVSAWYAWGNR